MFWVWTDWKSWNMTASEDNVPAFRIASLPLLATAGIPTSFEDVSSTSVINLASKQSMSNT